MTTDKLTLSIYHPKLKQSFVSIFVALCLIVVTFSAERIIFEALFPRFTILGHPLPATLISLLAAALAFVSSHNLRAKLRPIQQLVTVTPFLLNLPWLLDPTVDFVRSRLIVGTAIWLTIILCLHHHPYTLRWRYWLALLLAYLFPIYAATLGRDVGTADTFEFQVTASQMGIAHPTGYPLYLMLGKLWTLLPFGRTIAMRLNVGTMVYALIAVLLIAHLLYKLFDHKAHAILLASALGLLPTFWSQAIQAEVYSLHAVFIIGILSVIHYLLSITRSGNQQSIVIWLALLAGFGMTNHVTTVLLAPAIGLALIFMRFWQWQRNTFLRMAVAAILPLILYAYLPIRWQAVNGEPMGLSRLFGWVTGTRFAGALVWRAWLDDMARWGIIGRIYHQEWGTIGLILIFAGFIALFIHNWRFNLSLTAAWVAFSFYALNYYVPDLNVFMLPALIIMTIWWAALPLVLLSRSQESIPIGLILVIVMVGFITLRAVDTYKQVDASAPNDLIAWAQATLDQPLAQNAAILADSDKFPPLYYLQQAEGVRPDLDIMVLPDEIAYRHELHNRYTNGQTVYLARYLPNLPYPMQSAGSLVEILSERNQSELIEPVAQFDTLQLVDAKLQSSLVGQQLGVTLRWQVVAPPTAQQIYFRWRSVDVVGDPLAGVHPVQAYYPTAAWQVGEVITDFHLLEPPLLPQGVPLLLEIAVAPPFADSNALDWVSLGAVSAEPTQHPDLIPLRIWSDNTLFNGAALPTTVRPVTWSTAWINGTNPQAATVILVAPSDIKFSQGSRLSDSEASEVAYSWLNEIFFPDGVGEYGVELFGRKPLRCGWFSPLKESCPIGNVDVRGIPLPPNATNYADQIALLNIDVPTPQLIPAGIFELTLHWQSLAPQPEDYTVFVQVLDQNDQIVGQVDSWPVQGTYPTTQWQVGETISDPYKIQLSADLTSGNYRLIIGLYNLRTLQRLPILDQNGIPINDKSIIPNLYVP